MRRHLTVALRRAALIAAVLAAPLLLAPGSVLAQNRDPCSLLAARDGWREILADVEARWGVSPGAVLAVIDQESRFRADARGQGAGGANPSRNFGYAQANIRTWNAFLRGADWQGSSSRTDFEASAHFVGWHFATLGRRNGLAVSDVAGNYLVYKLGEGGYRRGAPAAARRLAATIASRAAAHDEALADCLAP